MLQFPVRSNRHRVRPIRLSVRRERIRRNITALPGGLPFNHVPTFVTVYAPGAYGDYDAGDFVPVAIIGLEGETGGTLDNPVYIAVSSGNYISRETGLPNDIIFVSDVGQSNIQIYDPFDPESFDEFFFTGTLLGTIEGGKTKFKRPEGIALGNDDGALYVVNNNGNSLQMFTDFTTSGGNIPPTLQIQTRSSRLHFPVGVAVANFFPTPPPTFYTYGHTYGHSHRHGDGYGHS